MGDFHVILSLRLHVTICYGFQIVLQLLLCAHSSPNRLLVWLSLSHIRLCLPVDYC